MRKRRNSIGQEEFWDLDPQMKLFEKKKAPAGSVFDDHPQELFPRDKSSLVFQINKLLREFTKAKLVELYGADETKWWLQGVPENVRLKCAKNRESDKERYELIVYANFVDYRTIIINKKNWKHFRPYFQSKEESSVSKEKVTEWLIKVGELRNIVAHVKRELAEEEVNFIEDCYEKLGNIVRQSTTR